MEKRKLLNLLLLDAISLRPVECCFLILISLFNLAKDAFGNDDVAEEWLKNHVPGDRTLSRGLKDDPTYVAVENDRTPATYGINVVVAYGIGVTFIELVYYSSPFCHDKAYGYSNDFERPQGFCDRSCLTLHELEAMRKAEAAGNEDCPVKIKLVTPPAYVLNTQTLDKEGRQIPKENAFNPPAQFMNKDKVSWNRGWFYYRELRLWFTRVKNMEPLLQKIIDDRQAKLRKTERDLQIAEEEMIKTKYEVLCQEMLPVVNPKV